VIPSAFNPLPSYPKSFNGEPQEAHGSLFLNGFLDVSKLEALPFGVRLKKYLERIRGKARTTDTLAFIVNFNCHSGMSRISRIPRAFKPT